MRKKVIIAIAVAAVLVTSGYLIWGRKAPARQFVAVKLGSILETVSATGSVIPVWSVSLGFENSGTVARVYKAVGDKVTAGELLAALNTGDLSAQLRQAQADVDTQTAKLEGLKAGAQPEDIAVSAAALDKARQDLENMYASASDTLTDAFAKANDAVRTQLNTLFSNAESQSPHLTFNTSNSSIVANAQSERLNASVTLNQWQTELASAKFRDADSISALQSGLSYLAVIKNLLNSVWTALDGSTSLDSTTLTTDKSNVITALNETNTVTKNLNTLLQNIASQKLTVSQAAAALALKKAGSTKEALDAQEAQVEQAQANVASVQAKLQNSYIVSPIQGTITQFDAKVGESATANSPLVSVMSTEDYKVEVYVPEADSTKLTVGNTAEVTLDAYGNDVVFGAVVVSIDPAEHIIDGVSTYKTTFNFVTKPKPIKSGMTANVTVKTNEKPNVLVLPQRAIVSKNGAKYVNIINEKNVAVEKEIKTGLKGSDGMIEIVSGLNEGDKVVNYTK